MASVSQQASERPGKSNVQIPVNEISVLLKPAEASSQISNYHVIRHNRKFALWFCKGDSSAGWLKLKR